MSSLFEQQMQRKNDEFNQFWGSINDVVRQQNPTHSGLKILAAGAAGAALAALFRNRGS